MKIVKPDGYDLVRIDLSKLKSTFQSEYVDICPQLTMPVLKDPEHPTPLSDPLEMMKCILLDKKIVLSPLYPLYNYMERQEIDRAVVAYKTVIARKLGPTYVKIAQPFNPNHAPNYSFYLTLEERDAVNAFLVELEVELFKIKDGVVYMVDKDTPSILDLLVVSDLTQIEMYGIKLKEHEIIHEWMKRMLQGIIADAQSQYYIWLRSSAR